MDTEEGRIRSWRSEEQGGNGEREEEQEPTPQRPPSSYGSMRSDEEEEEEDVDDVDEEIAAACGLNQASAHFKTPQSAQTGLQLIRSESPETIYTTTTQQTRPPGAMIIDTSLQPFRTTSPATRDNVTAEETQPPGAMAFDTSSFDMDFEEDEDLEEPIQDDDENVMINSPEPPEPIESDELLQEDPDSYQSGRLHSEQDMPHIFKSILDALKGLTAEELFQFKVRFSQRQSAAARAQMMEGDVLDFVDKMFEVLGQDQSLLDTLSALKGMKKETEEGELRKRCSRALVRFHLKENLIRRHKFICEGVPQPGKQKPLQSIYVSPKISIRRFGNADSSHRSQPCPASPVEVPNVNDLFRLCKENEQPIRTVVTTGFAGMGMTVSVGKFCLDWAELTANKNLQFVIKLSFLSLWRLRNRKPPSKMSIMEAIEYNHPDCKDMAFLEAPDCKFVIVMDSFDCYQASLDWKKSPTINDIRTPAHPDDLIVNLIRGNLLPGGFVWILGRKAATSQIPAEFVDVVTEIEGFSGQMQVDYLTRRFTDQALADKIVAHYRRLPILQRLCQQPFVCWMVATVFEHSYHYVGYGVKPPKLTPFYNNILVIQTNRKLQFYYNQTENNLKWSNDDRQMLMKMGKMALSMLEKNNTVFTEEDLKHHHLKLTEVTVFSGLCTENDTTSSKAKRTFSFIHITYQEFMAALYVFGMYYTESKNVLDSGSLSKSKVFASKDKQTKTATALVQSALDLTLGAPWGQYDMFLRFLCGLLCPGCHKKQLQGNLFPRNSPPVARLEEVQQVLERHIHRAPPDRQDNLKECLRELTQEDS